MATTEILFTTAFSGSHVLQTCFEFDNPFTFRLSGHDKDMQVFLTSISREDGSGERFLFNAVTSDVGGPQVYSGYWDSKTKTGWVRPEQTFPKFMDGKSGTEAKVKNGPNLTGLVSSIGLRQNHNTPLHLTVSWPWGVVWYPNEVPFAVSGIERTGTANKVNVIGTINVNEKRRLKVVVIGYDTHSRKGSLIVYR